MPTGVRPGGVLTRVLAFVGGVPVSEQLMTFSYFTKIIFSDVQKQDYDLDVHPLSKLMLDGICDHISII